MTGDGPPVLTVDMSHGLIRLSLHVQLEVRRETLGLVGPSGAGKSSVLRAVAGLLHPDRGRIELDGRALLDTVRRIDVPPERRGVGMVFQEGALFPHMSVASNVAFGLRGEGSRREIRARVGEMLDMFGIEGLAAVRPERLSGGERRRVALARAVAARPRIVLLDEPLAGLDPHTKGRVATELMGHLRAAAVPAVLVSHDFGDVVGLADRVSVMEGGRVVQTGSAADLLQAPASPFVAALTGVNYFRGTAAGRHGLTEVAGADGRSTFVSTDGESGPVGVVVYPWDVALSLQPPPGSALNRLVGPIQRVVGLGNRVRVTVGSTPPIVAEVTEESVRRLHIALGVPVVASWKATGTRLIPLPGGGGDDGGAGPEGPPVAASHAR